MSIYLDITPDGVDVAIEGLSRLDGVHPADLLEVTGAVIESQTRRRLSEEKRTPDGEPWREWGKRYARTRKPHHKLLENDGDLIASIDHLINGGSELLVGSALPYARRQNDGDDNPDPDRGIPARTYIGMSHDGRAEVMEVIMDFIRSTLASK